MRGRRLWAALAVSVVVPGALIAGVWAHVADAPGGGPKAPGGGWLRLDATGHFFLAACVVLGAAFLGGRIARRAGQPPVVGEICAGLALGPSLLGHFAPAVTAWLFPAPALRLLDGLAQLGLVLFMFGVGQELAGQEPAPGQKPPGREFRGVAARAVLVSQASMLVPFALGAVAATRLLGFAGPRADPLSFALFLGCALSITALPVLARILTDLDLTRTEPGRLSLFAAAVGDAGSWLVLAWILVGGTPFAVVGAAAAALILLGPVRGALRRWAAGSAREHSAAALTVLLVVAVTGASALTAALGIHQLIGALLVGLVWPGELTGRDGTEGKDRNKDRNRDRDRALSRGKDVTHLTATARSVLLPFFFFGFGLTVDLTGLRWDARTALALAGLLSLAVLGKLLGPGLVARLTGMAWKPAVTLGVLLNARGLTELVVVQIGYQAGIIDRRMLGILTLVALITTAMTTPLLRLLGLPGLPDPLGLPDGGRAGQQPGSGGAGGGGPAEEAGADRHAAAEAGQEDHVVLGDQALAVDLVEGDGDGRRARVPVAADLQVEDGVVEAELRPDLADHDGVGLVRDEVVD